MRARLFFFFGFSLARARKPRVESERIFFIHFTCTYKRAVLRNGTFTFNDFRVEGGKVAEDILIEAALCRAYNIRR